MAHSVSFDVSKQEAVWIQEIVKKTIAEATRLGLPHIDPLELEMDLTACHCNGNPLLLHDLLNANLTDLMHDVLGIRRFLDRRTGHLTQFFSPRYSRN